MLLVMYWEYLPLVIITSEEILDFHWFPLLIQMNYFFDNVQGDFITGAGNTVSFVNNDGITTALNYAQGGNVLNRWYKRSSN